MMLSCTLQSVVRLARDHDFTLELFEFRFPTRSWACHFGPGDLNYWKRHAVQLSITNSPEKRLCALGRLDPNVNAYEQRYDVLPAIAQLIWLCCTAKQGGDSGCAQGGGGNRLWNVGNAKFRKVDPESDHLKMSAGCIQLWFRRLNGR